MEEFLFGFILFIYKGIGLFTVGRKTKMKREIEHGVGCL